LAKIKPVSDFRGNAGLAAKLRRAIALALDNGGNGEIVGVHYFTVPEFLALGEAFGLLANVVMMMHGHSKVITEPRSLGLT
jgi:hypothetical protein